MAVSNVDLSSVHVAGLGGDVIARFLDELAGAAGIVLHVRLAHGEDERHVLDSIFKALGAALGERAAREGDRPHRSRARPVPGAPYSQAIISGGFVFVRDGCRSGRDHKEMVGRPSRSRPSRCSRISARSSRRPVRAWTSS